MQQVEVIAWFKLDEFPVPIRIRITNDDKSYSVINLDKILDKRIDNTAGNKMINYKCQTIDEDILKPLELRYEVSTRRWFLYKM